MDVELAEIRDFLAHHPPFDELPDETLASLPRSATMTYARRGSQVLRAGDPQAQLWVVRSGAVDITDQGHLVDRIGTGGFFGMSALMEHKPARYDVTAREDSLLLVIPEDVFSELTTTYPTFALHFAATHHGRIKKALGELQTPERGSPVLRIAARELLTRGPVTSSPEVSITQAAQIMTQAGVSSLLITHDDALVGIVTDRDLRRRVLAEGRDPATPVSEVMTQNPVTLPVDALAFEMMLEMTGRNIHHLPVLHTDGTIAGLITTTDLVRLERSSPVYLVNDLKRQTDVDGIILLAGRVPEIASQLVDEDATAEDIGRVLTTVVDAITVRLIELAMDEFGPAPAGFTWVTLGSAARQELSLGGDQDHALVLADDADPSHTYWAQLAERVTDGLERCGWPRCIGEVMATNPRWRMTTAQWRSQFLAWAHEPEPDAVLQAAIFYDMRAVYGDATRVRALREQVVATAGSSRLLLTHLGHQATRMKLPLGFFRGFVLEDEGEHRDTLDIKRGIAAIVQLARIHALHAGSTALGTQERLNLRYRWLSRSTAQDLRDALELLSYLRVRHQVQQVSQGREPNNFIDPEALGTLDRRHLRDAFGIIRSAQQTLTQLLPRVQ